MKRETLIGFVILLVIAIIAYGYLNASSLYKRISDNRAFSLGVVLDYEFNYKSRKGFNYEFNINGKSYKGFYLSGFNKPEFISRMFPVICNSEKPTENALLIFPKDFERYDLHFPDSLSWVLPYE